MPIRELVIAIVAAAIWELLRRLRGAILRWYRSRGAFHALLKFQGEILITRSTMTAEGPPFIRGADADIERLLPPFVASRTTHDLQGFMIHNPAHNLIVLGSTRYNATATLLQRHFALPYQFVLTRLGRSPAQHNLRIVSQYGDEFTASVDRLGFHRGHKTDYAILFFSTLANTKRAIWIAGIHGAGTLGAFNFLRQNAALLSRHLPHKNNTGIAWLLRITYEQASPDSDPTVVSTELLGDPRPASACTSSPARAIVCDLGNVLCNFDRTRTYRALGRILHRQVEHVATAIEASDIRQRYERGDLDTDTFTEQLLRVLEIDPDKLPRLVLHALWSNIFWENYLMTTALKELRAQGITMVLLSNTNPLHFDHIRRVFPNVIELFDELVLSFDIRTTKPDEKIFHTAIEAARSHDSTLRVSDIAYVDDEPEHAVAAERLGMRSITYNSYSEFVLWLREQGLYVP